MRYCRIVTERSWWEKPLHGNVLLFLEEPVVVVEDQSTVERVLDQDVMELDFGSPAHAWLVVINSPVEGIEDREEEFGLRSQALARFKELTTGNIAQGLSVEVHEYYRDGGLGQQIEEFYS